MTTRFSRLARKVKSPALAAWIGRKKYGREGFQRLATAGKARKAKARGTR